MIIDNKKFDIPVTEAAREHLLKQKVTKQIRTAGEGITPGFTKPNKKRHQINPGGSVQICAGISGDRVVLWEDVGKRWNGERAAEMYLGPILKTLKKVRGVKASYLMCEDNDPAGYKSGKGKAAKRIAHIKTVKWPRYSPDLNPLDFSLWANIGVRMDASAPEGRESILAFKKRLRRTALRTSKTAVRKMVAAMKGKAKAIFEAEGGDIASD